MEGKAFDEEREEMSEKERLERFLMGRELRKLRESQGLSVAEVSAKTNPPCTEETVAGMESGGVPLYVIPVLSVLKALDVPPEKLEPNHLLTAFLTEKGYTELTEKNRESVDCLTGALLKEQRGGSNGAE